MLYFFNYGKRVENQQAFFRSSTTSCKITFSRSEGSTIIVSSSATFHSFFSKFKLACIAAAISSARYNLARLVRFCARLATQFWNVVAARKILIVSWSTEYKLLVTVYLVKIRYGCKANQPTNYNPLLSRMVSILESDDCN